MSSKKSDRAQYQSGLKKLRETGLYTGKADARKKPSSYLKSILKKYWDVLSGKSDRAQYQSGLKKLREVGLYTGKADARKKPSPYLKSILKKYSDVLSGKSIVVENKAAAKLYKGTFRTTGDLVIIPKAKGEKIYVSKKTGEITTTRKFGKQTIKSTVLPGGGTASEAKNKTKGYYVLHLKHGGMRFQSYDEMVRTVNEVSPKLAQAVAGGFDWKKWVTFETVAEGKRRQAQGKKYGRKK